MSDCSVSVVKIQQTSSWQQGDRWGDSLLFRSLPVIPVKVRLCLWIIFKWMCSCLRFSSRCFHECSTLSYEMAVPGAQDGAHPSLPAPPLLRAAAPSPTTVPLPTIRKLTPHSWVGQRAPVPVLVAVSGCNRHLLRRDWLPLFLLTSPMDPIG